MVDLQPTLLDTTLLQYCIFLGFVFSFAYFSVFFAFGLSRLMCDSCAHFGMFCRFFSFFVSCFGVSCGLSSVFFAFFFLRFFAFFFAVFLCFLRFFAFFLRFFCVFFAFFLRFVFVIALYGDEKVNVILSHKICAESKIFLLF